MTTSRRSVCTRAELPALVRRPLLAIAAALALGAAGPASRLPRFAHWIDGTTATEPELQVQRIDADTFVVRQSIRTNFEAPFLYLLFGRDRVLLLDSGAGGLAIRPTIERLIGTWRADHGGRPVRLVVAHSHGHGDHHAGDDEFRDRPDTDIVGLSRDQVASFFGIANWPDVPACFELGGRCLDIIPTPGHEPAHIMLYDARTQLLLSGDMLYPGRLYVPVDRFAEYRASADRLAAFARTHPIRALLGAHVEMMATPGRDYPMGAVAHPLEHALPLSATAIFALQTAVRQAPPIPVIHRYADFILYPRPSKPAP